MNTGNSIHDMRQTQMYLINTTSHHQAREMQYGNASNTTPSVAPTPTSAPASADAGAYDFFAFLAWYLFLIICCVVPTVCAFRRRQQHVLQQIRQQHLQQMLASGILGGRLRDVGGVLDTEEARKERLQRVQEHLKVTTMTVKSKDLIRKSKGADNTNDNNEKDEEAVISSHQEIDLDGEIEREFSLLQLHLGVPNGSRQVPAACAICLCPYEVGDQVTHSPHTTCQHAFHTECITTWLAKKHDQLCPCCRQNFCDLPDTVPDHLPSEEDPPMRPQHTSEGMTFTY